MVLSPVLLLTQEASGHLLPLPVARSGAHGHPLHNLVARGGLMSRLLGQEEHCEFSSFDTQVVCLASSRTHCCCCRLRTSLDRRIRNLVHPLQLPERIQCCLGRHPLGGAAFSLSLPALPLFVWCSVPLLLLLVAFSPPSYLF